MNHGTSIGSGIVPAGPGNGTATIGFREAVQPRGNQNSLKLYFPSKHLGFHTLCTFGHTLLLSDCRTHHVWPRKKKWFSVRHLDQFHYVTGTFQDHTFVIDVLYFCTFLSAHRGSQKSKSNITKPERFILV